MSAVKTVFRRHTRDRLSISNGIETDSPVHDNVSVISGVSRGSNSIHRILASSKSSGSLGSDYSQSQHDLHSLSSKRTGVTGTSRTSRSNRGPPSAYNLRRTAESMADDDEDDAHRQSSSEIRTEIAMVQAEYKRILDNYHGAEMAASAKLSASQLRPSASQRPLSGVSQATIKDSTWAAAPSIDDTLRASEFGAAANGANSSTVTAQSSKSSTLGRFGSLRKKASSSSQQILSTSIFASSSRPPAQSQPSSTTITKQSSFIKSSPSQTSLLSSYARSRTSNVSSTDRPRQPTAALDDREADDPSAEQDAIRARKQIDKIRASREDAVRRYTARLEYLETKLKTAEIHERLLKKK